MELNNNAMEVLVRADVLRQEGKVERLCIEHVFYGLLELAEEAGDGEARQLLRFLEERLLNVHAAKTQLHRDGIEDNGLFQNATEMLGRAAEMAGEGEIGLLELGRAVFEYQTPTVRALCGLRSPVFPEDTDSIGLALSDSLFTSDETPASLPELSRSEEPRTEKGGSDKLDMMDELERLLQAANKPAEPPVTEAPPSEPVKPAAPSVPEKPASTGKQAMMDELERLFREGNKPAEPPKKEDSPPVPIKPVEPVIPPEPVKPSKPVEPVTPPEPVKPSKPQKTPKARKRCKLGLFTYRGGIVAAAIQYFLFGILVPLVLFSVLDVFTGWFSSPSSRLGAFAADALVCLWVFYLFWGVVCLARNKSKAAGIFLQLCADYLLLYLLLDGAGRCRNWSITPVGLRILVSLVLWFVLVRALLNNHEAGQEGLLFHTKLELENGSATPGSFFFGVLLSYCIIPLIAFTIVWVFHIRVPGWAEKVAWLYLFATGLSAVTTLWSCLEQRCINSTQGHKGRKLYSFLKNLTFLEGLPLLVLYLHRLFGWSPMKKWVMIVLAVYAGVMCVISLFAVEDIFQ